TCNRPLSAARRSSAASAAEVRPPSSPMPPAAAASLSTFCRLSRRSSSPWSSFTSVSLRSTPATFGRDETAAEVSRPLVAGWADDPHHLRGVASDVHQPVRDRAPVVDGVAGRELEHLRAQLERDDTVQDD